MATKKKAAKKATKKPAAKAITKAVIGKCGAWTAVLTWQYTAGVLTVTGKCVFPTHGYKVKLIEASPQGINPLILLLKKVVTPPTGPVIQTPQTVKASFTKKTKTKYKAVTILPDGTTVKVKLVSKVKID